MAIINESAARIAKELSSFSDYVEGSATASYNAQCAEAAAILEQVKPKCATADQRERAEWLYNRYCTVLAEAINRKNEIGTRCPSVLICGPANFPVRKKEKQVAHGTPTSRISAKQSTICRCSSGRTHSRSNPMTPKF